MPSTRPGTITSHVASSPGLPDAALLFPPLVDTNFGAYYPSTAVLAGHLEGAGLLASQHDLNEEFAVYLLRPSMLDAMAHGEFGLGEPLPVDAMPCIAARLLSRTRTDLFDAAGRHRFREESAVAAHLLGVLAAPFLIDVPLGDALAFDGRLQPQLDAYTRFFEWAAPERVVGAARVVGISVPMGPQLVPTLLLARHLKAQRPDLRIVCGGPAFSLMALGDLEALLAATPSIDAVVRFDGETPLLALVEQQRAGHWSPAAVPGVSAIVAGAVSHAPPGPGLRLDELALPVYAPQLLTRLVDPELGLVQTRGCYWGRCAYCDFVELYEGSPRFRTRTAQSFVDEVERQIARYGTRRFCLVTEAIPPAFAQRFSEAVLARSLDIRWNSFAMVDPRFTPALLALMASSGCEYLIVGLETMVDRVLRLVRKAATAELNRHFLIAAHRAGMRLKVNLIPDLPTTTRAEAMRALDELRELAPCMASVAIFPFEATRSSVVGRNPEAFGLVVGGAVSLGGGRSGQAEYHANHLPVRDPAMTDEERADIVASYRAFADEVNGQRSAASGGGVAAGAPTWRLAHEHVDIVQRDGWVQCYNAATRQLIAMPDGWATLLRRLAAADRFTARDFGSLIGAVDVAEYMIGQLRDHGLVHPA